MFSSAFNPNSLRLRPPPPPGFASTNGTLPSPTSPSIQSPRPSPIIATATASATAETASCVSPRHFAVSPTDSLYKILGISMGATGSEIKSAYRRLARTVHPDVKDSSADEFMKVHAAYSTLSDPDKRADYDRRLFRVSRSRTFSGGISTASYNRVNGYSGRNWETDQCW